MRNYLISILASGVSLTVAGPATAQNVGLDVRCMLVSNVFVRVETDLKRKTLAQATGLYFSGRVTARLSAAQIKDQIIVQAKSITKDNGGPIMTECAKRFQEDQRMMQAVAQQIQKVNPVPASK